MKVQIFAAIIEHRHGADVVLAGSRAALDQQVASYAMNFRDEVYNGDEIKALAEDGRHEACYLRYFRNHPNESVMFFADQWVEVHKP